MSSLSESDERYNTQLTYLEAKASGNQKLYIRMRRLMLVSSWLTPLAIFAQVALPDEFRLWWSFVPMILSTVAVGSYQWEEQHNYGSQWSKFRLVAENLKRHKALLDAGAAPFRGMSPEEAKIAFVEITEKIIEGTDVNYFTLMVDPRRDPMDNAG